MKKVAIITFSRGLSYGAMLQAFALKKTIEKFNCKCDVINYGTLGDTQRFILTKKKNLFIKYLLIDLLSIPSEDIRRKKFKNFMRRDIGITKKHYSNQKELQLLNKEYDYFVAGSDQIWNPFLNQKDLTYLLDFVEPGKIKIAYAPSFGITALPNDIKADYEKYIKKFDYLSVREVAGQKIIDNLLNVSAKVVLDPTFLISADDWSHLSLPPQNEKDYILCFTLGSDRPKKIDGFLNKLSNKTKYEIISVGGFGYIKTGNEKVLYSIGPRELLGLIKNAKIVITNSFHGTVFSIIFKKQFYTFMNDNMENVNTRLEELSNKFDLRGNILYPGESGIENSEKFIDYERVHLKLDEEIKNSLAFLEQSLINKMK